MKCIFKAAAGVALVFGMASSALAASFTCPGIDDGYGRGATVTGVDSCAYGNPGNPDAGDIATAYPPGPWTSLANIAGSAGSVGSLTDSYLTVTVTSGSWGNIPASGTWSLDSNFWNHYGTAVLSFHVGDGADEGNLNAPDWWAFEITKDSAGGTWSIFEYDSSAKGGGFSNMRLWGGDPASVPVPGTLGLLGLGLAGLGLVRRRSAA